MKKRPCSQCDFYYEPESECRRYAPRMEYPKKKWLDIHNSELLRDIVWTLRIAHGIKRPDDPGDYINEEATEIVDELWPRVGEDDWCGEFVLQGTRS